MKKLDKNHVSLELYPGLIDWLSYHKSPDALVCKLLTDYRHRGTRTTQRITRGFCAIVFGLMLGYGWCTYHRPLAPCVITYPDIAIDLTVPKHLTSRKYMTHRERSL